MTLHEATGTSPETPAVTTNNNSDSSDAVLNVKKFLTALDSRAGAVFNIEAIPEKDESTKNFVSEFKKAERYPGLTIADVCELIPRLQSLNNRGAAICVAVNQFDGQRLKTNLKRVRGIHADFDSCSPSDFQSAAAKLPPTLVVESSRNKFHAYWLLSDGEALTSEQAESINRALVARHRADEAAVDVTRLLRLPGFKHMKSLRRGVTPIVRSLSLGSGVRYTVKQIASAFPAGGAEKRPAEGSKTIRREAEGKSPATDRMPTSYARLAIDSLRTVLSHIDADSEQIWSNVANALSRVHGEAGRQEFHSYSKRSDKYDFITVDDRYTRALGELSSRSSGYGTKYLIDLAKSSRDWLNPPLRFEAEACTPFVLEGTPLLHKQVPATQQANSESSYGDFAETQWPEIKPLPPKNPPTPALNIELLPRTIQAYVKDCADRLQVPPEMIATPLLISFGNVIGKKAAVYPKRNDFSWYEYPNLWGCCVAPPASLKSPALMAGLRFSREIESDMRAIYDRQLRAWKLDEKLRKASTNKTEKAAVAAKEAGDDAEAHRLLAQLDELEPPVCGRLTTTDATPEARLELLRQNPNGLMQVVDELDGHFQRLNRDGYESARAQELTFYDGKDDYAEDRVKRGSNFVESPRVAMYGNLQPAKVEGYMRALATGGRDDGYLQRLFQLVAWPTLSTDFQPSNNPEDMSAQETVRAVFNTVHSMQIERDPISQRINPKILRFTPEAQESFDKLYVERERYNRRNSEANPVLAAHRGKMIGTVIKLSLICALLEDPRASHIDLRSLNTAVALVSFYFTHAKRAYRAATRSGIFAAHALLAKINSGKVPNPFSARDDVYEKKWAGLNTAETHEALSILMEHGYLHEVDAGTTGRPRRLYLINPVCTRG